MKKILIALVFVCLLCALFSVSAFATETDAAAVANTESTKTVINVADVTNADEGLYTLADAIAYANNEGISEYTLKLTEDINVDEQIVIGTKVDMTVDLCGYTLSSSVLRRLRLTLTRPLSVTLPYQYLSLIARWYTTIQIVRNSRLLTLTRLFS